MSRLNVSRDRVAILSGMVFPLRGRQHRSGLRWQGGLCVSWSRPSRHSVVIPKQDRSFEFLFKGSLD